MEVERTSARPIETGPASFRKPPQAGPPLHAAQSARIYAWARITLGLVLILMAVQIGRVVQLKIDPDPQLHTVVGSPFSSRAEVARRGDLLDRRGRIIATTSLGYRLFVDPQLLEDLSTIAVELAHLLEMDPIAIDRAIIPRRDTRYVRIVDLLEGWQVEAVRSARLRGVGLEVRPVRHVPHGEIAASLVGRVGFDHTGLAGLEHRLDEVLEAEQGRLTYLRDARRRALWIHPDGYTPAREGRDVALSIDMVVQEIAERRLRRAVDEFNAGGGRLLVMDPRTGEVLAMTDIVNHRDGWTEPIEDPLRDIDPALGRNRCVSDPYEPGSTFKPFVWAVATELGKARLDEVLPTPGAGVHRTSRGRAIRDAFNHGDATWREVLIKSLNSGMAIVAERMTERQLQEAVARYGFGRRTNSGLPGETAGILTRPGNWTHYTQTSVPMGHEIAVTPLQMVRAFSVFARNGTLPPVRLRAVAPEDREFEVTHRVLPEAIALAAREVMRDSMSEGTGRRAQSRKYQLFAKSGTAQLPRRDGRGYHEDRYVASFIAGAPFSDPRVVVLCVIDDPDKSRGHFGGAIAGPVVRDVIDEALTYLGVAPDQPGPTDDHAPALALVP